MKKNLLLSAAFACAIGLSASAENTITVFNTYFDESTQSNELLTGSFYSVSPNGKFACFCRPDICHIVHSTFVETNCKLTVWRNRVEATCQKLVRLSLFIKVVVENCNGVFC